MSEINHRWLKDNHGDRYFPVTHSDAVLGIHTTGWQPLELINGAKNAEGYTKSQYKYDEFFGMKQLTLIIWVQNITEDKAFAKLPEDYVRESGHVFNAVGTIRQYPNKLVIYPNGDIEFVKHYENSWNSSKYAGLETTWQL